MSDAIAEVQAMVGCQHNFAWFRDKPNGPLKWVCRECDLHSSTELDSAPDCSTLWGALQAACLFKVVVPVKTCLIPRSAGGEMRVGVRPRRGGYDLVETEREAATAICELILQATNNQGGG